ncbi:hypothetical protein HID58_060577 [Brassica napus]|uniref:Rotamase n=2 Tax=Brassica napus TaxID=3708 RepID=A0ABQ7ZWY8_BRANA|nr:hypothetical protein HID58_060577 [Brassica napus]
MVKNHLMKVEVMVTEMELTKVITQSKDAYGGVARGGDGHGGGEFYGDGAYIISEERRSINHRESTGGRKKAMLTILSNPLSPKLTSLCESLGILNRRSKSSTCCSLSQEPKYQSLSRRNLVYVLVTSPCLFPALPSYAKTKSKSPYDERRLLEQNKRIQRENNAPDEFPNFVREGFEVKVVASDNYVKADSGLIYRDFDVGQGDCPKDGQQVTFHYIGYNESGRRIDSTYIQGTPAKIRMGTNALVGPSTFFSSKQFEVFDVELVSIQNCERRTIVGFYSDVTCN